MNTLSTKIKFIIVLVCWFSKKLIKVLTPQNSGLRGYIIVVRNKIKNLESTYFHFFVLKANSLLFCRRDIPTNTRDGYCISNAVDYAKKNDVLPSLVN